MRALVSLCAALAFVGPAFALDPAAAPKPAPRYLVVLGIAQDGGVPQAGSSAAAGWHDPSRRRLATSLAVVDEAHGERYLFEATPDFPEQLQRLDELAPRPERPRPALDGIFLTHAHMGHYTGLMWLGKEVMGASKVPVYAMPRMARYLRANGPWSQLVRLENIELKLMKDGETVHLPSLAVTPLLVPHRQEYSEVVGFRIETLGKRVLFIPDIDSWEQWDEWVRIEDEIAKVDVAYLDATFFANGEIPGRDMSGFPHPFIRHSMERFAALPASEKAKIRFIHLNHTNPALWPGTPERAQIEAAGFRVAEEGERIELE